jgi:hypothetical protein
LLIDHLLKVRPKFRKALELQVHVHGMLQSQDMMHKQPLLCSHDFYVVVHALHLDEKTSLMEDLGRHPRIAIPIHRQRGEVSEMFQPWHEGTTVS